MSYLIYLTGISYPIYVASYVDFGRIPGACGTEPSEVGAGAIHHGVCFKVGGGHEADHCFPSPKRPVQGDEGDGLAAKGGGCGGDGVGSGVGGVLEGLVVILLWR